MPDNEFLVLMPVFNDWAACDRLLVALDEALAQDGLSAAVLFVDDGSTVSESSDFARRHYVALSRIEILRLRRNLGHQRAICVGLSFIGNHEPANREVVVLMDSDGEDDPRDVPRLLRKFREEGGRKIVFAERTKRSESLVFRFCYATYRLLHQVLTSHDIHAGNFSVMSRTHLRSLVVAPELWNHYASAVRACRLPQSYLSTARGKRLAGERRMNFVGLVIHGLSAISVFSDVVGVRLLLVVLGLAAAAMAGVGVVVVLRFFTNLAIPGWATSAVGLLLVMLLQAIILSVTFSFIILASRNRATFLPARDCEVLIDRLEAAYPKP